MSENPKNMPSGWHIDPDTGTWMRNTIHSMARRCRNWDYCGTGTYLITLVLNDRARLLFGRVAEDRPEIILSELGRAIERHFRRIAEFTPEIEVLGVQVMPEHLHGVLRVKRRMVKPLGERLRGFKIGATKIARELGVIGCSGINAGACVNAEARVRGHGLFADGFTDTILFDAEAVAKGLAYVADNPRRLWVKRAHPELFRVLRDLRWRSPVNGREMHFAGIGNHELLNAPLMLQVQCSRSYFTYARNAMGKIDHAARPLVETPEFSTKAEALLAAAAHGAVLVSPCISPGEKEIARRAFAAGHRVITLSNKGISPLYKPGGRLFDQCAAGNLLMLAPAGWPYLPGEKKITRMDACVLNRIAQLMAREGAVEIDYKGAHLVGIEEEMLRATEAWR